LQKLTAATDHNLLQPGPGSSNGQVIKSTKNFLKDLEEEEMSRKREKKALPLKQAATSKGAFRQTLKSEEANRRGSVITLSSRAPSTVATKKGMFWDDLKAEEISRNGSLISASSKRPSVLALSKTGPTTQPPSRALSTSGLATKPQRLATIEAKERCPPSGAPKASSRSVKPSPQRTLAKLVPKPKTPGTPKLQNMAELKPSLGKGSTSKSLIKAVSPAAKRPLDASTSNPGLLGVAPGIKKPQAKPKPPKLTAKGPIKNAQKKEVVAKKPVSSTSQSQRSPMKKVAKA